MIKLFIDGFCEGFSASIRKPTIQHTDNSVCHYRTPAVRPAPKYVPPDDFVVERCTQEEPKPAKPQPEHKPKKKKQQQPDEDLPSNIKAFTLPDGSVIYINTEETEMSEESVIDSIIKPK